MYKLSELFMKLKRQYRLEEFDIITEPVYKKDIVSLFEEYRNYEFENFKKDILQQNIDISKLRIGYILCPVLIYSDGFITKCQELITNEPFIASVNMLKRGVEHLYTLWDNKEYDTFFQIYDPKFVHVFFEENYKTMTKDDAVKSFIYIYTKNEGYFTFNKELICNLFEYGQYSDDCYINEICDDKGYVKIYRGEGKYSTNIVDSLSWTTSSAIAYKFAYKFDVEDTTVYSGKIHKSKILYYTNHRNEKELIIKYEDVVGITKLHNYSLVNKEDINDVLRTDMLFNDYNYYKLVLKKYESYYNLKESIHGILHSKRVLFLSLVISKLLDLNSVDKHMLAVCSILHDLKRVHDGIDDEHGFRSAQYIEENTDISDWLKHYLSKEEIDIVKEIIRFHPIDDSIGIYNIETNNDIHDKERAIKLYKCFKDCDNLDRIRIDDLDKNYLRFEESKKLIGIAYELFHNLK